MNCKSRFMFSRVSAMGILLSLARAVVLEEVLHNNVIYQTILSFTSAKSFRFVCTRVLGLPSANGSDRPYVRYGSKYPSIPIVAQTRTTGDESVPPRDMVDGKSCNTTSTTILHNECAFALPNAKYHTQKREYSVSIQYMSNHDPIINRQQNLRLNRSIRLKGQYWKCRH
jgi:hypothetical protein